MSARRGPVCLGEPGLVAGSTSEDAFVELEHAKLSGDEGGFVMAWFALLLIVLLAFSGFAIDVGNWWYVANQEQRAADAAALAGSVFLPGDLAGGQSRALTVAEDNGFQNGTGTVVVTATQEPQPTRMRVKVQKTVTNFFSSLVGYNSTMIYRQAVADYQGPVPMGSPTNTLGQDPEEGNLSAFWLNISGPGSTKISGDRFTSNVCDTSVARCQNGNPNSLDYLKDNSGTTNEGYTYKIHVAAVTAGQPLVIQVYDPAFIYTDDFCKTGTPDVATAGGWTGGTPAFGNNPGARYGSTDPAKGGGQQQTNYCTGDQMINNLKNLTTTYMVRVPDLTPWNDYDNAPAGCDPVVFRPINTNITTVLTPPTSNSVDAQYVRAYYHRWVTVCTIPSGSVAVGDYVLQVRTNNKLTSLTPAAPAATYQTLPLAGNGWSDAITYDPSVATGGHNRFALRAGWGTSSGNSGTAPSGTNIGVFAAPNLPIYANAGTSSAPQFYLARVTPNAGAGRSLILQFFDIGDVSTGSLTLKVLAPTDPLSNYAGGFPSCTFSVDNGNPAQFTSALCQTSNMTNAVYNGRLVTVIIPIPGDYTCDYTSPTGCWLQVRMTFQGGAVPSDTTTWSANVDGDPVRLVA